MRVLVCAFCCCHTSLWPKSTIYKILYQPLTFLANRSFSLKNYLPHHGCHLQKHRWDEQQPNDTNTGPHVPWAMDCRSWETSSRLANGEPVNQEKMLLISPVSPEAYLTRLSGVLCCLLNTHSRCSDLEHQKARTFPMDSPNHLYIIVTCPVSENPPQSACMANLGP